MCGCEDNPPSCSSTTTRVARKAHRCYECGAEISKRDRYQVHSGVWDGRGQSFKWCADCETLRAICDELSRVQMAAWRASGAKHGFGPEWFCFCFGQLREAVGEFLR
jgi:hypothetical protein